VGERVGLACASCGTDCELTCFLDAFPLSMAASVQCLLVTIGSLSSRRCAHGSVTAGVDYSLQMHPEGRSPPACARPRAAAAIVAAQRVEHCGLCVTLLLTACLVGLPYWSTLERYLDRREVPCGRTWTHPCSSPATGVSSGTPQKRCVVVVHDSGGWHTHVERSRHSVHLF
jgi:hypothetical protein